MSTKYKLFIAKLIYKFLKLLGFKEERVITRNNIKYQVCLKEGIDLSLFLFGSFQGYIFTNKFIKDKNFSVIFDIVANVGAITLPLAQYFRNAIIYAFEPTNFAYEKLLKNIELNPNLKQRIKAVKVFVSNEDGFSDKNVAYSSWKVDGSSADHPIHGGILQEATNHQITIDSFVKQNNIEKVDFIKLDVDGSEFEILQGGKQTIKSNKPIIIFEFMNHNSEGLELEFEKYLSYFSELGYNLLDSKTGKLVLRDNIRKLVPSGGGIDILCLPK